MAMLKQAVEACSLLNIATDLSDATELGLSVVEAGLAKVGVEVGVDPVGGLASVFKFGVSLRPPPGQLR